MRREDVLGVILAGGQSRRFGQDKALAPLGQMRLIEHVAARAAPQVGALAVSGRDYGLGLPVIADQVASEGPLSGVLSALSWAQGKGFSAIATFSCDAPFFPENLVAELAGAVFPGKVCGYVRGVSGRHPVFALWHVRALDDLARLYDEGVRALKNAQDRLEAMAVTFPEGPAPGGDMFFNINRPGDQHTADRWLNAGRPRGESAPNAMFDAMPSAIW